MKYLVEYDKKRESYDIYDMAGKKIKNSEPERICTLDQDQMDVAIDLLLANIRFKKMEIECKTY